MLPCSSIQTNDSCITNSPSVNRQDITNDCDIDHNKINGTNLNSAEHGPYNSKQTRESNSIDEMSGEFRINVPSAALLDREERLNRMEVAFRNLIECIDGEDITRKGLEKTPRRAGKAFYQFTSGYNSNPQSIVGDSIFDMSDSDGDDDEVKSTDNQSVFVKNIDYFSLCEHHLVPFFGQFSLGYIIPSDRRVIGLSKLVRISRVFSRRLQMQERLTEEIAEAVSNVLGGTAVGVILRAKHFCMCARGVSVNGDSYTLSSCFLKCTAPQKDELMRLLLEK